MSKFIIWTTLWAAFCIGVILWATHAHARDPTGKYAHSKWAPWFEAQMSEPDGPWVKPYSCCRGSDWHKVEVKSLGNGKYLVKTDQGWVLWPWHVNPTYENPTGSNWASWVDTQSTPSKRIFWCLRLSLGM